MAISEGGGLKRGGITRVHTVLKFLNQWRMTTFF